MSSLSFYFLLHHMKIEQQQQKKPIQEYLQFMFFKKVTV